MPWQPLHFYLLNKKSCMTKKAPVTSPIETSYNASVPSKFSNWQGLFTRSTITVKVTRLLALQVCLLITPLLILLLWNHGFWIAEQPITLHLIHNFSHTLHHHLFQMLICPQSTAPISSTGTIKFNDIITLKDVLCVPSFNLNLMSISKITSFVSFLLHMVAFYRTWLREDDWLG